MTALHPDNDAYPRPTAPSAPPPGCPAHGLAPVAPVGPDGTTRLYGPAAEADPMGLYGELRTRYGGVAPVLLAGDVPAWLVLGYQENLDVARTPMRFTRDSRRWRDFNEGRVPADSPLIPMVAWRPDCISQDGPEHQRLRAAVTESLERFDRRGIRRHVLRYADQLIDGFCTAGQVDLLERYAQHLPMLVLTHLFGLPEEVGPRLVLACTEMIKGTEDALAHNQTIVDILAGLVEAKSKQPGYDFASWLIAHPSRLTQEEVLHHLRLVLIAANETTTNLIANVMRVVLTDTRFRASLAGGLMTVPDAVEQVLWDEPPLMVLPGRFATSDTELAGHLIREGDLLITGLAAGNVDPYIRPDLSAPVHGNRAHLAFSRGPHECPGQDIGRTIAEIAVDTVLVRLPDVRLAVDEKDLSWTSSTWARHLDALPVVYTPRAPKPRTKAPTRPAAARSAAATAAAAGKTPAPEPVRAYAAAPRSPEQPAGADGQRRGWWPRMVSWLGLR